METFDVIVIGAGTSGLMAAITAAKSGARTLLIEKNKRSGQKLLMTGGGRCNVTNAGDIDHIIQHIPGNGRFLYSAFAQFDNQGIIKFFTSCGVTLKEEDHGRMFPITNKAKTILQCLLEQCAKENVTLMTNTPVTALVKDDGRVTGVKVSGGKIFLSSAVIIATGGKTHPATGSTGDGYEFAKRSGHSITPLFPTEVPLTSNEDFIKKDQLQGVSLQDISLSVLNGKGKSLVTHRMDMIFTHFGISGPAALRCSSYAVKELAKNDTVLLSLDLFPDETAGSLLQRVQQLSKDKSLKNGLKNWLPERMLRYICDKNSIDLHAPIKQLTDKTLKELISILKAFPLMIHGSWPLHKAFVTGGGVSVKEIQPKTLESKCLAGLYFTGEVMDIHGYTGGYNITAAFVTGHVAGKHAADAALNAAK